MNELNKATIAVAKVRRSLLATASAVVLATYGGSAQAAGDERPTVWIEGGWHFESIAGKDDPFIPPLDAATRSAGFTSLTTLEDALGRTYGGEGGISFQPKGSDWLFSLSGRYGRVQTRRRAQGEKTVFGPQLSHFNFTAHENVPFTPSYDAYALGTATNRESHALIDFQVGKDIGIGLLGRGTDSIISFGARYAEMNVNSKAHSYVNPNPSFGQFTTNVAGRPKYHIRTFVHRSSAFMERSDSLRALGPSLSLQNTTSLLETADDGQLALDWGVNAAILFGRQKARSSHHSTVRYTGNATGIGVSVNVHPPVIRSRSHMVTVPNVGGFAALSYRFARAKLSAGYRADFLFGARDGGLETRSTTDVGFHGPFATISIGLGG